MAKTTQSSPIDSNDPFAALKAHLDEHAKKSGYIEQSDDVAGYWAPELTPIHCVPISAKLFDGNLEAAKPAILILVRLLSPCALVTKKEDGARPPPFVGQPGKIVGIWGKPGMKVIRNMAGAKCFIELTNKVIETGKPNPMKLFRVTCENETGGSALPVVQDKREKSKGVETWLDGPATPSGSKDDDDIPF